MVVLPMKLLFYILSILLCIYIIIPLLFRRKDLISLTVVDEKDKLLTLKAETYNLIKDLEYDYQEGKITETDYQNARNQLMEQAVAILKELETHR
jgi:competence protein ComGC